MTTYISSPSRPKFSNSTEYLEWWTSRQSVRKNLDKNTKVTFGKTNLVITPNTFNPDPVETNSTSFLANNLFGNNCMKGKTVLDIGAGSGVLSIEAVNWGARQVFATDIEDEVLECAASNARTNRVLDKIQFGKGSVFDACPKEMKFDFIIANGPIMDEAWTIDSMSYGQKLFSEYRKFLNTNGLMLLSFADFGNVTGLQKNFQTFDVSYKVYEEESFGCKWQCYKITK